MLKGYSGGRGIDRRLYLHHHGGHRLEETDKQTEYRKTVYQQACHAEGAQNEYLVTAGSMEQDPSSLRFFCPKDVLKRRSSVPHLYPLISLLS